MKCPFAIAVTLAAFTPHVLTALAIAVAATFSFHAFVELSLPVAVALAAFMASMFAVLTIIDLGDIVFHGW